MQLAREELEQAYRQMKTIREFEDHLHREIAKGKRLNIPSGTSIRFEPGQKKKINLVEYKGKKVILGFNTY